FLFSPSAYSLNKLVVRVRGDLYMVCGRGSPGPVRVLISFSKSLSAMVFCNSLTVLCFNLRISIVLRLSLFPHGIISSTCVSFES
ncbi:MAG: hypothetical protein ABWJ42_04075, partial [Sulfolobales archaeon]